MILFLVGASGVRIRCCLKPVEVNFLLFRLLLEGPSAFCSVRWLLGVFLAVTELVSFRAGGRLPIE